MTGTKTKLNENKESLIGDNLDEFYSFEPVVRRDKSIYIIFAVTEAGSVQYSLIAVHNLLLGHHNISFVSECHDVCDHRSGNIPCVALWDVVHT